MSTYQYGVWPDGLLITKLTYESTPPTVFTGTHVGNSLHVLKHTYEGSNYNTYNVTYNASYCTGAESYVLAYGATYAATYHRNTMCNVRSLEWI